MLKSLDVVCLILVFVWLVYAVIQRASRSEDSSSSTQSKPVAGRESTEPKKQASLGFMIFFVILAFLGAVLGILRAAFE